MLKGYMIPRSPLGHAAIDPPPPWHYSGDVLAAVPAGPRHYPIMVRACPLHIGIQLDRPALLVFVHGSGQCGGFYGRCNDDPVRIGIPEQ